jgi:hypothetical protein
VREEGKGKEGGRKGGGRKGGGRGEEGREGGTGPVVVRGWWCGAIIVHARRREWSACMLIAIAAGGGSLSVRGRLCALVVVVGRVVAWWVLAAVDRYGVGVWGWWGSFVGRSRRV